MISQLGPMMPPPTLAACGRRVGKGAGGRRRSNLAPREAPNDHRSQDQGQHTGRASAAEILRLSDVRGRAARVLTILNCPRLHDHIAAWGDHYAGPQYHPAAIW